MQHNSFSFVILSRMIYEVKKKKKKFLDSLWKMVNEKPKPTLSPDSIGRHLAYEYFTFQLFSYITTLVIQSTTFDLQSHQAQKLIFLKSAKEKKGTNIKLPNS